MVSNAATRPWRLISLPRCLQSAQVVQARDWGRVAKVVAKSVKGHGGLLERHGVFPKHALVSPDDKYLAPDDGSGTPPGGTIGRMSIQYRAALAYIRFIRSRAFRANADLARYVRQDDRLLKDPPASIRSRLDAGCAGRPGYELWWLAPRMRSARTSVHVLYLHGGAFVFGITPTHWRFLVNLVEKTGCTVHVPLYPRAPRHSFVETQAAALDATRYASAFAQGQPLILMGDSAGASLAFWLTSVGDQHGLGAVAANILISPCTDLTLENTAIPRIEKRDPWLTRSGLQRAFALWLKGTPPGARSVNPMAQRLSALPPVYLFIGDRDILFPDCMELARRLHESGTKTEVHVGRGMCHVWPLLPVPEARDSISQIHAIIRQHQPAEGQQ